MRTRWEDLHHTFDRTVRCCDGAAFMREARGQPALDAFSNLQELFAYLLERGGDPDERDRVLAALVFLARVEVTRQAATALLWLALWPGLCGVYARRRRRGVSAEDALSAISCAFTLLVAELDLSRVTRVAATLVRSTEREAITLLRPPGREVTLDEPLLEALRAPSSATGPEVFDVCCLAQYLFGDDTTLVIAVAILEETQGEAAAGLGISAAAARKRYQRALHHARSAFASV